MSESKHILIVEDEEHLAVGIKYNLEAEGYRVSTVGDGVSALKLVEEHEDDVHLVLLDLMLPGMSGYSVCESLRERGNDMPVLILSARTLTEDRTRGFDVGADQYLNKPFELDELMSRVKNLLARSDRRNGTKPQVLERSAYSFGATTINFDTYEVVVDGTPAKLTALEMRLLRYFIDNEGRVISRDELLREVWDLPATVATRAVDQFIRRLRKIFEPDPANPQYFLTVRDAGYRFVADNAAADSSQS